MGKKGADLFGPKLPPINLLALAPAWIFEARREIMVNQRIEQLKKERDEYKEALIQCRKHQLIDNGLNNCQAYRKAKEDVDNMKGNRNETD